jgi:hypothetical protein
LSPTADKPVAALRRRYVRTIGVIAATRAALKDSGQATPPSSPTARGDTELWTFERRQFSSERRVRVRVRGSGFVHAGIARAGGVWDPVYNVPLVPLPDEEYEAVLPIGVNAFTFFWTEPPLATGRPGHWDRGSSGGRVFRASGTPPAGRVA